MYSLSFIGFLFYLFYFFNNTELKRFGRHQESIVGGDQILLILYCWNKQLDKINFMLPPFF